MPYLALFYFGQNKQEAQKDQISCIWVLSVNAKWGFFYCTSRGPFSPEYISKARGIHIFQTMHKFWSRGFHIWHSARPVKQEVCERRDPSATFFSRPGSISGWISPKHSDTWKWPQVIHTFSSKFIKRFGRNGSMCVPIHIHASEHPLFS